MEIETLEDVLHYVQALHKHLRGNLHDSSHRQADEHLSLLLDYIADHEKKLSHAIDYFIKDGDRKALHTWCNEYFNKQPISSFKPRERDYSDMSAEEIVNAVLSFHQEIVDLYRFLHAQVDADSAKQMLEELIQLEEHEAMRMSQTSNRWSDM